MCPGRAIARTGTLALVPQTHPAVSPHPTPKVCCGVTMLRPESKPGHQPAPRGFAAGAEMEGGVRTGRTWEGIAHGRRAWVRARWVGTAGTVPVLPRSCDF